MNETTKPKGFDLVHHSDINLPAEPDYSVAVVGGYLDIRTVYRNGDYSAKVHYDIELDRIDSKGKLLNWVLHLTDKDWMTNEIMSEIILAVDEHCGWGLRHQRL